MKCPNGLSYPKCKCDVCKHKKAEAQKRYRRMVAERAHGIQHDSDPVPTDEVLAILKIARDNGATLAELTNITGINHSVLQKIPTRTFISRGTHRRIIERLQDPDVRLKLPTSLVPSDKTIQVVRSLMAQGFTQQHQMEILKKHRDNSGEFIKNITRDGRGRVTYRTELLALWLEANLSNATGPNQRTATWARNRGYFPLKHYDAYGKLMVHTLNNEQKAIRRRVQ